MTRPRHAILATLLLAFAFAAASGCYPDFEYRGDPSGGGGQVSTAQVTCNGSPCEVGQFCCKSQSGDDTCDMCSSSLPCESQRTACDTSGYEQWACDGDEDCNGGHCCAQLVQAMGQTAVQSILCSSKPCNPMTQAQVCKATNPGQCGAAAQCLGLGNGANGTYPGYLLCTPD